MYDIISFSNCTKELSFASFFCMAVFKISYDKKCDNCDNLGL